MRTRAATVAGVLGLATAVSATGNAIINNNCDYDVYLWPVSVDHSPSSATVIKGNGGTWSQSYQTCSSGGMSLKLSSTDSMSDGITQFEYTLEPGNIWYDISNVNCLPFGSGTCPFAVGGMTLESGSGCPVATCEGGNDTCHDAYTYPDDNWASLSCEPSADTTMNLCGSSSGSSSGGIIGQLTSAVGDLLGGGSSSTEAPSTSTTPTTTAEPTTTTKPTPTPTPTTTSTTSSSSSSSSTTSTTSTTSSSEAAPTPAAPSYSHKHQWSPPAAVSDDNGVAAAAAPTPTSEEAPSSSYVATTFATVAVTTAAPENPNVAVVYETVTTMVSTTVVYQHKMFHKEKRNNAHPHARRHQHEE